MQTVARRPFVRPEPSRQCPVPGLWGYVDRLAVTPGEPVRVHVSSEASFELEIVRLGQSAILDARATLDDDRQDSESVASIEPREAVPGATMPGSYVWVGGPEIDDRSLTVGAWIRPWRLPYRETNQWSVAGVITDLDYPSACRFGLLIDGDGTVCAYVGDGGSFRHGWLIRSSIRLDERIGKWTHVALGIDDENVVLWADGNESHYPRTSGPFRSPGRLRVGAAAEDGVADWHLDADISQPFVASGMLGTHQLRAIHQARGGERVSAMLTDRLLGEWLLDEECGDRITDASGHDRDGVLVNGGTWQIGGPAFDAAITWPGYDPLTDPSRGHGLRLSSDDLLDAEWPVAYEYTVPTGAQPGFYSASIRMHGQRPESALALPFIVRSGRAPEPGSIALIVPTNTWHAYGRRFEASTPPGGLHSSFYTTHESRLPFLWLGTALPIPRANPFGFDSTRASRQRHSQLVRPERIAAAWLRRSGYQVDFYIDEDLHDGIASLESYACLLLAGHSEYWTDQMRSNVEAYLAAGGRVVSLSGDTASQRVSFSPNRRVIEARKCHDSDHTWLTPKRWGERWHAWGGGPGGTFRSLDRPSWTMLGVSTQGMIDDGTPTAYAPLVVLEPQHALFAEPEVVPIEVDGTIGNHSVNGGAVSGYEFDAVPSTTGFRDKPLPGLTVLASALNQPNLAWIGRSPDHGADSIHWVRPDGGEVFTISSIGASGSLPVDPGIGALVRNALARFGAVQVRP